MNEINSRKEIKCWGKRVATRESIQPLMKIDLNFLKGEFDL